MDLASLVLRLSLGIMFTAHGLQLSFGLFKGPGVEAFSKMLAGIGMVPALFWAYIAAYSCLIGGICLIAGLCTRIACIPLMIFMLVAMVKVHLSKGFFLGAGGYEYNFIIISSLIALVILGTGKYGITKKI